MRALLRPLLRLPLVLACVLPLALAPTAAFAQDDLDDILVDDDEEEDEEPEPAEENFDDMPKGDFDMPAGDWDLENPDVEEPEPEPEPEPAPEPKGTRRVVARDEPEPEPEPEPRRPSGPVATENEELRLDPEEGEGVEGDDTMVWVISGVGAGVAVLAAAGLGVGGYFLFTNLGPPTGTVTVTPR